LLFHLRHAMTRSEEFKGYVAKHSRSLYEGQDVLLWTDLPNVGEIIATPMLV